jgi:hypothetical protein
MVTAGGELTLETLDFVGNGADAYQAPLQMLANGGVLLIDDFGRQSVTPAELLNRWMVPLESRVDYLTFRTGQKFEVPFEVLIVFATNLNPAELVDEAFLRRIRYKVCAEDPTPEEFSRIFERYCGEKGISFNRFLVDELLAGEFRRRGVPLRGCQPRDLIEHALSLAAYLGRPRELTLDLLQASCATYFVDSKSEV